MNASLCTLYPEPESQKRRSISSATTLLSNFMANHAALSTSLNRRFVGVADDCMSACQCRA